MNRFARAAIEVVRLACARERLEDAPEAPVRAAPERDPRRILRLLFRIEPLEPAAWAEAVDGPVPRAKRRDWLRWIFAPEPLPADGAHGAGEAVSPERPRRSWLRWLFAPESLPHDPEQRPARRRSRLAALFVPERLDDSL